MYLPEPRTRFVTVGGVRLHLLDWGGDGGGDPLLLVPGLGQSAHVFRELAPAFTGGRRVLALSPRAHGESEMPQGGYAVADFAAELEGVLDALEIEAAVLAAHSGAGAGATRLAAERPERVRGIVYLDGTQDYAGWSEVQRLAPVEPPARPAPADDAALREWFRRYYYGFWCDALEADWRARPSAFEGMRRWARVSQLVDDAAVHPQPYVRLRCPALALVGVETVETLFPWLGEGDRGVRARAAEFLRSVRRPWRRAGAERFLCDAERGSLTEIPGGHFFFLTERARTVDEMGAFLDTLGRSEP